MLLFDESFDNTTVAVPLKEEFELHLDENPTTGYRWMFINDGSPHLVLNDSAYEAGDSLHGAPGRHHWRFASAQEGNATVKLGYRRRWESEAEDAATFTLQVSIKPA